MNVLKNNKPDLSEFIDSRFAPETSVVCRYRNAFNFGSADEDAAYKQALLETSLREGARIFPLLTYRGVEIHLLDESSLMHTGTLKSIDGCITAAKCKTRGYKRVVFESGGNTGTALTEYCGKAGLETFLFIPEENLSLLDSKVFQPETAHLISVAEARWVKKSAHMFRGLNDIQHIPEVAWRYEASRFRGCLIREHIAQNGNYDWIIQTISAAFGPIGIYSVLSGFNTANDRLPKFLGVQQEANCPMYKAWKSKDKQLDPNSPAPDTSGKLLTRVMYDVAPQTYGTFEDLKRLLTDTSGDLTTINHSEFSDLFGTRIDGKSILEILDHNGVHISTRNGEVIEKTGLIALAGVFKEIAGGSIAPGSRVLCCLTSGTRAVDGNAKPEYRVSNPENLIGDCHRMIYGA
jgi:threonine synthase